MEQASWQPTSMSEGPGKWQFATINTTDSKNRHQKDYESNNNLITFQAENREILRTASFKPILLLLIKTRV